MKKLVFIYPSTNPLYINILNELAKDKTLEIHFIAHKDRNKFENVSKDIKVHKVEMRGFGIYYLNLWFGFDIPPTGFVKGLNKILKQIKPDFITVTDIQNYYFWQCLKYVKKNPNTKLIPYTEFHHFSQRKVLAKITKQVFKKLQKNEKYIHKILTFTDYGKEHFQKLLPNKEVITISPAMNLDLFKGEHKEYLKNDTLKLLIVARMVPFKDYPTLLEALKILIDKKVKVKLSIRGDGPIEHQIQEKIKELKLEKHIKFLPAVNYEKVKKYFQEHDIFVLSSINEAIGMVVPDSMCCYTPTITSDTTGANSYVEENKTGLIFKTKDPQDLANKIEELNNKKKLEKFGKQARKRIENKFTIQKVVKRLKNSILK